MEKYQPDPIDMQSLSNVPDNRAIYAFETLLAYISDDTGKKENLGTSVEKFNDPKLIDYEIEYRPFIKPVARGGRISGRGPDGTRVLYDGFVNESPLESYISDRNDARLPSKYQSETNGEPVPKSIEQLLRKMAGTAIKSLIEAPSGIDDIIDQVAERERKELARARAAADEKARQKIALSTKVLDAGFTRTLRPLVGLLRGEPMHAKDMQAALYGTEGRDIIRSEDLAGTRLTASEKEYVKKVSPLSTVNSYIRAALKMPELTVTYLQSHFDRLTRTTREAFPNGSYAPVTVAGTGVHGIIAASVILRDRPDLLDSTLFLDDKRFPMGPFMYPNGKAWELNSANPIASASDFVLPNQRLGTSVDVAHGIFRWAPGQRNSGQPREGDINRLVDYWLPPRVVNPGKRYLNNYELAASGMAQASMLFRNFNGNTKVITRPEFNSEALPNGLVPKYSYYVRETNPDSTYAIVKKYYTDVFIGATGLGEEAGSDMFEPAFEDVNDQALGQGKVPPYLTPLTFYKYAADRTGKWLFGDRIGVIGGGDSAVTALEAAGGSFDVKHIGGIKSIVVFAVKELSKRARYARTKDLVSRDGRTNPLAIAEYRAQSIKNSLLTKGGLEVEVEFGAFDGFNHVVAATGNRNPLKDLYGDPVYAEQDYAVDSIIRGKQIVGQSVYFVGNTVADRANFTPEKLGRLPAGTQNVLAKISENVVSIGLTGIDTEIAVAEVLRTAPLLEQKPSVTIDDEPIDTSLTASEYAVPLDSEKPVPIDEEVASDPALMSTLLLAPLTTRLLANANGKTEFAIDVRFKDGYAVATANGQEMPRDLLRELAVLAAEPVLFSYAQHSIANHRSGTHMSVKLTYNNGRLSTKRSFVQAA